MDAPGFTAVARSLTAAARSLDLTAPVAFRSPPRKPGETRTLRRLEGSVVVSVAIHGRSDADVILDMVAGLLKANGQADSRNRDLLLDAAYDSARDGGSDVTRDALGLKPRADVEHPPCDDDRASTLESF